MRKNLSTPFHPGADISSLPTSMNSQVTFAPSNTYDDVLMPKPKADTYGMGYDPVIANPDLAFHRSLIGIDEYETAGGKLLLGNSAIEKNSTVTSSSSSSRDRVTKGTDGFAIDDTEDDIYDDDSKRNKCLVEVLWLICQLSTFLHFL